MGVSLSDDGMVNHMVDHIGANGMAVAGFFIHKDRYSSDLPGEAEQEKDPLFVAYKKLAKDQSWLSEVMPGLTHKTWTFGYGHKKAVAEAAGCTGAHHPLRPRPLQGHRPDRRRYRQVHQE